MRNLLDMSRFAKGGAILALAAALAGCANTGLMEPKAQGLSESFTVSTDSDAAYRRAMEYVRTCFETRTFPYGVTYGSIRDGNLAASDLDFFPSDAEKKKAATREVGRIRIFKVSREAKILELIEAHVESSEPVTTRVTVRVLGTGMWDQAQLAAVRRSIESATPSCRPAE